MQSVSTDAAAIAKAINALVPDGVVRSTVALLGSHGGAVRPIGSGTLLAVGEEFFVLSAAHVLRQAAEQELTVGVARDSQITACSRDWMLSDPDGARHDVHDVALYKLTSEEAARFTSSCFIRIGDVSFLADLSNSYFVICGFPALWTTALAPSDLTPVKSKLLLMGMDGFRGSSTGLDGFDSERHFLLRADWSDIYDALTGKPARFRSRMGHPVDFPGALQGISGCSVWRMGDLRVPPKFWGKPKLVGIETAVYEKAGAIRATRWNSVTTMLYGAFPSTRPTLRMYEGMHG